MMLLRGRSFLVMTSAMLAIAPVSSASVAADMTSRQVTALLFQADKTRAVDLTGKDLSGLDLAGLDFSSAILDRVDFHGSDLTGAKFNRSRLRNANLDRTTLIGADFTGADLSGATLLRPNNFSAMSSTATAEAPRFKEAKLIGANLNGRFDGVDFRRADLTDAFFGPRDPREEVLITPMMELRNADFTGAILRGADLSLNALESAKFVDADLTGANFKGARLGGADFTRAELSGADFTGAGLQGAALTDARGREKARGLDAANQAEQ